MLNFLLSQGEITADKSNITQANNIIKGFVKQ
jgi:hypothetical protein